MKKFMFFGVTVLFMIFAFAGCSNPSGGGDDNVTPVATVTGIPDTKWYDNAPSSTTNYTITNPDQLAGLAQLVNGGNTFSGKTITLGANMDLTKYGSTSNSGKGWIPIGTLSYLCFSGTFDGNNKTITGLYINRPDEDYIALFGYVTNATIENLEVRCQAVTGANTYGYNYVAVLAGVASNTIIRYCHVTGPVNGRGALGGLVGSAGGGSSISYCCAECNLTVATGGAQAGALVGLVGGSTISNCYATGDVNSDGSYIGGLAGSASGSTISNCYVTGNVSGGKDYVGGLVGITDSSNISNCAALNPAVTATVTGYSSYRIAYNFSSTLTNNAAFSGMKVNGSATSSTDGSSMQGADISAADIANDADGSIGGRFTTGWAIAKGKLPGFGTAVALPSWLQ